MRPCRPSWYASGHRQPAGRTTNGAPSAAWSSTWPHGVGRRSTGSSISSISSTAASRRPRRSCQRSSTRPDRARPAPPPAGPQRGSGPAGGMLPLMQVIKSILDVSRHAAGTAVRLGRAGPPCWARRKTSTRGGSVKDRIGLAMVERPNGPASSGRADTAWRSTSFGVSDQRRSEAELHLGSDPGSTLSCPVNEALVFCSRRRAVAVLAARPPGLIWRMGRAAPGGGADPGPLAPAVSGLMQWTASRPVTVQRW
jgi:hypothetical protein